MIGLDDLFVNQQSLQGLKEKLPASYFSGLLHSRIVLRNQTLASLNAWYAPIYFLSTLALLLTWAFWPWIRFRIRSDVFPHPQWIQFLTFNVLAIAANAAICGILSEPVPRYQTRISWIPLFIVALTVAKIWMTFSRSTHSKALMHCGAAE
jgi:CDP-diglyceride synthetase